MDALRVIRDKQQAASLLQGERPRLLALLREPGSASSLARHLQLPRQKVNYHLKELEKAGLVTFVAERKARNCMERFIQATARAYVISPEILAELGEDEASQRDRFSADYLLYLAGRTIAELGAHKQAAQAQGKRLATLSLDTEIRFATAADRNAFAEELATALAALGAKYHRATAEDGRIFRLVTQVYPAPKKETETGSTP